MRERSGPTWYEAPSEQQTRATCTWLFGSQMTALWLSFKMANECTQSTTQHNTTVCRTSSKAMVINYSKG